MKLFDKVTMIFTIGLCLLPTLVGIYFWGSLSDPLPTNINKDGEILGEINKYFALFGFPAIMIACTCLAGFIGRHRERFNNVNDKLMFIVTWVPAMMCFTMVGTWITNGLGLADVQNQLVYPIIGIILCCAGVGTLKAYRNMRYGIRTVWSIQNDENWRIANLFGGISFILGGFAVGIEGIWFMLHIDQQIMFIYMLIVTVAIVAALPLLYAYIRGRMDPELQAQLARTAEKQKKEKQEKAAYKKTKVSNSSSKNKKKKKK